MSLILCNLFHIVFERTFRFTNAEVDPRLLLNVLNVYLVYKI